MPDPSNPISFPPIDGSSGFTCGVYSFGWTSGCTDDNNLHRGFTQEWYYDGEIGAWVSVTEGISGGGADFTNAGNTYTSFEHTTPVLNGATGNIRQFAYLVPETGALTFGYIYTYDLVHPNESVYDAHDFSWQNQSTFAYKVNGSAQIDEQENNLGFGVTLCGHAGFTYQWSDNSSNAAFRWQINSRYRAEDGPTEPGPFAIPPQNSLGDFVIDAVLNSATLVNINGDPTNNLPFACGNTAYLEYYTNPLGRVIIRNSDLSIGFTTAAGPVINAFKPKLLFAKTPGSEATDDSLTQSATISTENYIYMFASMDGTLLTQSGITLDNYINGTIGSSGDRWMLNPTLATNAQNHKIYHRSERTTLGTEGDFYVYVATPTRCNVIASQHLQQNAAINQAGGFDDSDLYHAVISNTNEHGFTEPYDLFRSVNNNGTSSSGSRIYKTS